MFTRRLHIGRALRVAPGRLVYARAALGYSRDALGCLLEEDACAAHGDGFPIRVCVQCQRVEALAFIEEACDLAGKLTRRVNRGHEFDDAASRRSADEPANAAHGVFALWIARKPESGLVDPARMDQ